MLVSKQPCHSSPCLPVTLSFQLELLVANFPLSLSQVLFMVLELEALPLLEEVRAAPLAHGQLALLEHLLQVLVELGKLIVLLE